MGAGMELRQLRYFVTLAEELHFGRAADREHIVRSALSQQVQRLERELGVRLLARSTHHVSLTASGVVFLVEARQILAHVDRAAEAARSTAGAAPLRVGIFDSSYDSMPQILHEVQARFPAWSSTRSRPASPSSTSSSPTAASTSASAAPRSPRRRSHRCCSATTRSASWSPPATCSPTWPASPSPTSPKSPCCSPRTPARRNSTSSPSRCAGGRLHPHRLPGNRGEHRGRRRPRRRRPVPVLRADFLHRRAPRNDQAAAVRAGLGLPVVGAVAGSRRIRPGPSRRQLRPGHVNAARLTGARRPAGGLVIGLGDGLYGFRRFPWPGGGG
jgi:hypothetical protein